MIFRAIFIIQIVLTLSLAILASIFDFKKGIIPDKLNLFLLVFGLLSNLILSFVTNNIKYILASIISMVITYLITFMFWKLKIWGGGDVKLFTAIGTVIPFSLNLTIFGLSPQISFYPFSFTVIINSILVAFPYLFVLLFYLNYKNRKFKTNKDLLFNLFNLNNFYMFLQSNLNKMVEVDDLEEGMIINNYYFNDERVKENINEVQGNLKVYKNTDDDFKYYFKSKTAGGISKEDMYLLKILHSQNFISNIISVKIGFPFAPSIAVGLLISIVYGDLMIIFIKNFVLVM